MNQFEGLSEFMEQQARSNKMSSIPADGTSVVVKVLIKELDTKQDKNGNDYTIVTLSDGDGTFQAKMWKMSEDKCGFVRGDVLNAVFTGNEYNGGISYTLKSFTIDPDSDPQDFVIGPPESVRDLWAWIEERTNRMKEPYASIVGRLVLDNKETYVTSSAARSLHHSYIGGLLYHSCRMAKSADVLAPVYHLDSDVCVAGALIHDIGKTVELATDDIGNSSYTKSGQLEHHITIGVRMLEDAARELGVPLDDEPVTRLRHMILSHHGKYEFGSPALPATGEALLLHSLDMLDMKVSVWEEETDGVPQGGFSEGANVILETRAYKPKE